MLRDGGAIACPAYSGEAPTSGGEDAALGGHHQRVVDAGQQDASAGQLCGVVRGTGPSDAGVAGPLDPAREEGPPAYARVVVVAALGVEDGAAGAGQQAQEPDGEHLLQ